MNNTNKNYKTDEENSEYPIWKFGELTTDDKPLSEMSEEEIDELETDS